MSIAEIAAGLQAVIDAVGERRRHIAAVIDEVHRGRDRFQNITATSRHRLVGEALRQQTEAAERLREADRLLSGIPAALAEFAAAIGATVRLAAGTVEPQGRPRPATDDAPTAPQTMSQPSLPAAVVRLASKLSPWRDGENARGYAFDADHRSLNDEPFVSGRVRSAAHGLRPVRGGGHPVTVTDHVEGHVAARMRVDGGPREVTLVINKAPCADRPFGCDRLLPDIIPAGSRLTVYVVEANGPRLYRTYEGTGKAITA
jgi:hypothetical protein